MFHFFIQAGNQSFQQTVSHEVLLGSAAISNSPDILSGLARFHPLEYARATNGYVYVTSGLDAPLKWDGIKRQFETVGVIAPTTAVSLAPLGSGSITGDYRAYVRFVDGDGNPSNLSPPSDIETFTSDGAVVYTAVPVPTEDKVVRRQILRNTAGQFLVFYVDVDTTDLTGTTFGSTRTDNQLRTREPFALFNEDLSTFLGSRHGLPPNDKPLVAYYQSRLWMYGETAYTAGHVSVTFGSTTVTGIGTEWTEAMEDRFLYVTGSDRPHGIESIDEATQTMTLATAYVGGTDLFAAYRIRSARNRRHLLYYSDAGLFDGWPSTQALEVASSDDIDDEGTGLVSTQSFLYILQRRHIYRTTYRVDPARDGGIFLAARRGVVNNRSWVNVDGYMYCLDDRGIYRFDGSESTEDLSASIQDIFYFSREVGELRINWDSAQHFHASHDRADATIRWFVSFSGEYLPRHAICYNYSTPQWWIEEYPFSMGASCLFKRAQSLPMAAGRYRKVYALMIEHLDIVDAGEGVTRGSVVSSARRSLTVSSGTVFPMAGVVGAPIAIVEGRGKEQWRLITSVSGTRINVNTPWTESPDSTSTYQIGAFPWSWKSGWVPWPVYEWNQPRRVNLGFEPSETPNKLSLRLYQDYAREPIDWSLSWPRNPSDTSHVETEVDEPDVEVDLQQPRGFARLTIDSYSVYDEFRPEILSVELKGFASASPTTVYQIGIDGAVQ